MESTSNICNQELNFCRHIKQHHHNTFINNHISSEMKNFFSLKQKSVYKGVLQEEETKNYLDEYLVRNMGVEWVALNNPLNLSMSSVNREGCIFTIAFNETGNTMAASNHNHHIEIWDIHERKLKKTIKHHKEIVTGLEYFHGNSDMMMSCSLDKTIKLWKDYNNIHTFLDHSDWVRCLSLSKDNKYFLSGCVSSVVKLWDLEERKVLTTINNPNPDPDLLNTVNSLHFMNKDDNTFLCGLRNGTVKIFDKRNNDSVIEFKAHKNKLNSIKFSRNDKYLLSSGRDSTARLWDFRKLPTSNDPDICMLSSINQYRGHTCKGFNIDCNFFMNENYILTGSEDSHIYIYDTTSTEIVKKFKTHQKCVNLVKPMPDSWPYSFVFTGLEDISIHIWGVNKKLSKNIEKLYSSRKNDNHMGLETSEYDEIFKSEDKEANEQMKLIEEIMSECGDLILRIFHANNLTYSNGMNFENLMEIIQKNNDQESMKVIQMLNEKLMKKVMESFLNDGKNKKKSSKVKTESPRKKNIIAINCAECDEDSFKSFYNMKRLANEIEGLNVLEYLEMPNLNNSFVNLEDESNKNIEKEINIPPQKTHASPAKKLYSNKETAVQYKYVLNQFI